MVYIKKVVCHRTTLHRMVELLAKWRGPKSGKGFVTICVYLPPHKKHKQAGLDDNHVLIIARTG